MKVLIVDDHAIVRHGLKQILLERYPGASIAEAENGLDAITRAREHDWDIVVLDISMPGKSGLEVLKELRQIQPKTPVLILTAHPEEQYAIRVLRAGAAGYLTKESAADQLVAAVQRLIGGGKHISQNVAELLATKLYAAEENPAHETLSDREYQVLCLIASGKTIGHIARDLALSANTISTYRVRILEKMGMTTNADLTRYVIENGLSV
jgi:DNA-binding NarL/FixJ family response regulator